LAYALATRLFDPSVAPWAALLACAFPPYFLETLEFRADDLWTVCWVGLLVAAMSELPPTRRSALIGLVIGVAFCVSMKTVLFVISLAVAWLAASRGRRDVGIALPIIIVTAALPPLIVFAAFARAGVWPQMHYCVFTHQHVDFRQNWRVLWLIPFWLTGRSILRRLVETRVRFVFAAALTYAAVLSALWPLLALESYLPLYPVLCVLVAPLLVRHRVAI